MGYMRHHAIVVTTWDEAKANVARDMALKCAADKQWVSPVSAEAMNGYHSFCVFPDGSKEGWETSDEGDEARAKLIAWLDSQRHEDGSGPYAWVEVQFGDDNRETKVTADSDEEYRIAAANKEATEA